MRSLARISSPGPPRWAGRAGVALLVLSVSVAGTVRGNDPNACDVAGEEPDVIMGNLHQKLRHGTSGGITSFSVGTVSCNLGTCWLEWDVATNQHPVIGQNMFRLKDGRFEQIGQSWLKHGFNALSQDYCSNDCIPTSGTRLGVNCSDPYSAFANGLQDQMGPKFEVNPATGVHPHPVTDQDMTGDVLYKRLQVHNADLDPSLNPGSRYFVEGQYVAADDAAAGNSGNNNSYRRVQVSGSGSFFDFDLIDETQVGMPAIRAWGAIESGVIETDVHVPDDGLIIVATKATALGGGQWRYEYAVQNVTSDRAVGSFSVPLPAGATVGNIGFHDVDYHSGEPFVGTDWTDNGGAGGAVVWSTETEAANPNANALRWGTLYNFRFDADVGPGVDEVTLGLFKAGTPAQVLAITQTPDRCTVDGSCDAGETCLNCPDDCANAICEAGESSCNCAPDCGGPAAAETLCGDGSDEDCDGLVDCADPDCCADGSCAAPDADADAHVGCLDCQEGNERIWSAPGEVTGLSVDRGPLATAATLSWDTVSEPGGTTWTYRVLRYDDVSDLFDTPRCLTEVSGTSATDIQVPHAGRVYYYLVRAENACVPGAGALGAGSDALPRASPSCFEP